MNFLNNNKKHMLGGGIVKKSQKNFLRFKNLKVSKGLPFDVTYTPSLKCLYHFEMSFLYN